MNITDRRILLLPAVIAIGAWISSGLHSYIPVLVAAEIGLAGLFFMRSAEQKKIVPDWIVIAPVGVLAAGLAVAIYLHR